MDNNTKIFNDDSNNPMSLNDLFSDIYKNSKDKSREIQAAITTVMSKVQDINDVTMLMPLIRDLYEIGVKNDDALIKMSATVQRYITSREKIDALGSIEGKGNGNFLTEDEKRQLLEASIMKIDEADYKVIDNKIKDAIKSLEESNE
jgi:hypothetical protein